MSYYRSSSSDVPLSVYLIALAVLLLFSCIPGCVKVTDEHWETVTITDKDIKNKSKDSKYLIGLSDHGTSVYSSWLTDEGLIWREILRRACKEEENDG